MRSGPELALGLAVEHSTSPSITMRPEVMSWKPAMALSSVVLPQPEGPTIMQISPGSISSEQWSTAITAAPSGSYTLTTSSMTI